MEGNNIKTKAIEEDGENKGKHHILTAWIPFVKKTAPLVDATGQESWEYNANWLSTIFFSWVSPILYIGYRRTVQPEDFPNVNPDRSTDVLYRKFKTIYEKNKKKYLNKPNSLKGKYLLLFTLNELFFKEFWFSGILICISDVLTVCSAIMVRKIISYAVKRYELGHSPVSQGLGLAFGLPIMFFVSVFCYHHGFYRSFIVGAQVRSLLTTAIFQKFIYLSPSEKQFFSNGKITSLMSTDTYRIEMSLQMFHYTWSFIFVLGAGIAILVVNLGYSALAGIAVLFTMVPIMLIGLGILFKGRTETTKWTDARLRLTHEILQFIKIIKYYTWELPYLNKLKLLRRNEMKFMNSILIIRAIILALVSSLSHFASLVAFIVLSVTNHVLNPDTVFSSLTLFSIIEIPMILAPMAATFAVDALLSIKRIENFLEAKEFEYQIDIIDDLSDAIQVENASFKWFDLKPDDAQNKIKEKIDLQEESKNKKKTKKSFALSSDSKNKHKNKESMTKQGLNNDKIIQEDSFSLNNINLSIKEGEFVLIVGAIGSGKSSLLSAMAGLMPITKGTVKAKKIPIICHEPWVINATVKDNIIFGSSNLDEAKYRKIVRVCALERDLKEFEFGDKTEIGERGITISGGQKARINLARALYNGDDIFLFDDILSAVDAHVGRHLVEECLLDFCKQKTRVLATHQIHFLSYADRIVFLPGDGTIVVGGLEELSKVNEQFKKFISTTNEEDNEEVFSETQSVNTHNEMESFEKLEEKEEYLSMSDYRPSIDSLTNQTNEERIKEKFKGESSNESPEFEKAREIANMELHLLPVGTSMSVSKLYENENTGQNLISEERREENAVKLRVYAKYFYLGSENLFKNTTFFMVVFLMVLAGGTAVTTNLWLSYWIEDRFHEKRDWYIGFYVMLAVLTALTYFLHEAFLFIVQIKSSEKMNIIAASKIMYSPMSFFDCTPQGRIMNRFSKDTDVMDNGLTSTVRQGLEFASNLLSIAIVATAYFYWFAIAAVSLFLFMVVFLQYYRETARELRRIEAVIRSKVYSHFNESLSGVEQIRTYDVQKIFIEKNKNLVDEMNRPYYLIFAIRHWVGLRIDIFGALILFMISMLSVFGVLSVGPASIGLVLSYMTNLVGNLHGLIDMFAEIENDMNATERMYEYCFEIKTEDSKGETPQPDWPAHGEIIFENVSFKYRPELPNVLHNINIKIKSGEKIGICGRTGAGKSSIVSTLFRISELSEGKIIIDGEDISKLSMQSLRSKLTIIPQESVLFRGTVRSNLDPFGQSTDLELWSALRRAGALDETWSQVGNQKINTQGNEAINDNDYEHSIDSISLETIETAHSAISMRNISTRKENQLSLRDGNSSNLNADKELEKKNKTLFKFHLDSEVDDEGANFSLGERQLLTLARALVKPSRILILDEATSNVDYDTDAKIQETISKEFKHCSILCVAHRLKTIINYDRILVLDKGQVAEFDSPLELFTKTNGIFAGMCKQANISRNDFI